MKQKDLLLIGVVVIISAAVSLYLSNSLLASPKSRQQTVAVVQPISSTFSQPSPLFFNPNAYDPTQLITISPSANPNPFSSP
jgi:hypothetical protein